MSYDCADFVCDITGMMADAGLVDFGDEEDLGKQSTLTHEAILKMKRDRAALIAALQSIIAQSTNLGDGEDQPDEEEWDSMEDANHQGYREAAWQAAQLAREAIQALT